MAGVWTGERARRRLDVICSVWVLAVARRAGRDAWRAGHAVRRDWPDASHDLVAFGDALAQENNQKQQQSSSESPPPMRYIPDDVRQKLEAERAEKAAESIESSV